MLVRLQTNVGIWRVEFNQFSTEINSDSILEVISQTRPNVKYTKSICLDPKCTQPLDKKSSLESQGLGHGSIVYTRVEPDTCSLLNRSTSYSCSSFLSTSCNEKKIINADGSISLVPVTRNNKNNCGFRKGLLPLRDMKMQWTLQEFTEMDNKFVFNIKHQTERWVGKYGVSLDSESANDFQSYLHTFGFEQKRIGFLYGKFINDDNFNELNETHGNKCKDGKFPLDSTLTLKVKRNKKVIVEAIYEPPQEAYSDCSMELLLLENRKQRSIEIICNKLGLQQVGWIFCHPPREDGFQLSAAEVIMAAEYQLEAAGGVQPTPFVTVKVTIGDHGNASFEAFQVSQQCMEMVAEEAIDVGPNPRYCYVNETFTAIQEGKNCKTIENNFFLVVVPILQHSSEVFISEFPKANRVHDIRIQNHEEMRKQLSKSGSSGWTFIELLADFNLLIYISSYLDISDMAKICESVVNRDIPLDEGYKILISSLAGIDDSY